VWHEVADSGTKGENINRGDSAFVHLQLVKDEEKETWMPLSQVGTDR
jgi:hypothetical protein